MTAASSPAFSTIFRRHAATVSRPFGDYLPSGRHHHTNGGGVYGIAQISSAARSRVVRLSSGFARGRNDMFHVILQALGMGLFFATLYAALQFEGMREGIS
jgi:hypothetical protein